MSTGLDARLVVTLGAAVSDLVPRGLPLFVGQLTAGDGCSRKVILALIFVPFSLVTAAAAATLLVRFRPSEMFTYIIVSEKLLSHFVHLNGFSLV